VFIYNKQNSINNTISEALNVTKVANIVIR